MFSKTMNKVILVLGLLSLVHAAFSAAHHRTYMRLTNQEWEQLPLDLIIQTVVSLIVVVYSVIHVVLNPKEIRATVDLQAKSWDCLGNLPTFYAFNHRGKALHPSYEPPMGGKENLEILEDF